jgi:putative transcriptional regulator
LALAGGHHAANDHSIEVGKYTASLALAYKIARYFGLTIEEVFDFSNIDSERIL